jgi:hypothetical protein
MKHWRVIFSPEGTVLDVVEIRFGDGRNDWLIVEAPTEQLARKRALGVYCARKKKLAKARNHAEGRCACGRKQDRKHPSGKPMLTCSTCAARQKGYTERHVARANADQVGQHQRDEGARIQKNLARQRDRRAEIRLETLIECRRAWELAPSVGRYRAWLLAEIEKLTKGSAAA